MNDRDWRGYQKCSTCGAGVDEPCVTTEASMMQRPGQEPIVTPVGQPILIPHEGREIVVELPPGPMAQAVAKDLAQIPVARVPGGYTYAQLAMWLAAEIDKHAEGGPSVTAKLADQLGKAMTALTRRGDGDDDASFDRFAEEISEPVVGV